MEYTKTPAGIMIPKSNEFNLMQTLDCGQSFRWEPCNEKSNRRRIFTYMGSIF